MATKPAITTAQRKGDANGWVRDGLRVRGYNQRDLARAWGIAEASVSRFISGEEGQDMPLSRAISLSTMLDVSLEQVAKGLGMTGRRIEPAVIHENVLPPVGTFTMNVMEPGRVRIVAVQEVAPDVASRLFNILSGTGA